MAAAVLGVYLVCVVTPCGAVIGSTTRDGYDPGMPGQIERAQTRNVNGLPPGAIHLVDHESLGVTGCVCVISGCGAVAGNPARDRLHAATVIGGREARNLQCRAPGDAWLQYHTRIEKAITDALLDTMPAAGRGRDWGSAHPYLRTYLAQHAAA